MTNHFWLGMPQHFYFLKYEHGLTWLLIIQERNATAVVKFDHMVEWFIIDESSLLELKFCFGIYICMLERFIGVHQNVIVTLLLWLLFLTVLFKTHTTVSDCSIVIHLLILKERNVQFACDMSQTVFGLGLILWYPFRIYSLVFWFHFSRKVIKRMTSDLQLDITLPFDDPKDSRTWTIRKHRTVCVRSSEPFLSVINP